MHRALVLCLFVPMLSHAQMDPQDRIRAAADHAVAVVQHGSSGFAQLMQCFSCHDQALPMLMLRTAREHGSPVDEAAASKVAAKSFLFSPNLSSLDEAVQDTMIIDPAPSEGWALLAAHDVGLKPNLITAAYIRRVATWQRADGHWPTGDARPPQSYSYFTATALALRGMQLYMPAELSAEMHERSARARQWLLTATPQSTEDSSYRLWGLYWADGSPDECTRAAHELLALQRPDGGWSEIPHMPSDAYSTGEAMVALNEAGGVPTTAAAWQKGLQYLMATQQEDGSWHVHTRQIPPPRSVRPTLKADSPNSTTSTFPLPPLAGRRWRCTPLCPRFRIPSCPRPLRFSHLPA